ncbi:MAG: hypothetical protein H7338_06015 [Candidatus Sericytochromatia bacterium]|nr:hypothetical protein [Candidatus Sericytochromatia bacterium]
MAIARRPTPPADPDEGEGFSSDRFVGPVKKIVATFDDALTPTKQAGNAAVIDAPPPKPPVDSESSFIAALAESVAAEPPAAIADEVARAFRPAPARYVGRSTVFEDLELSADVAGDPDAKRYFGYMRLFGSDQVPGGLYGLTFDRARVAMGSGKWGRRFPYHLDGLISEGLVGSRALLASRFQGMLPVYKAWAGVFRNDKELKGALLEDLQLFVRSMRESGRFPPFAYRVV